MIKIIVGSSLNDLETKLNDPLITKIIAWQGNNAIVDYQNVTLGAVTSEIRKKFPDGSQEHTLNGVKTFIEAKVDG